MSKMVDLLNPILWQSIIAAATFFIFPTLGEIYAERSGILNLGIEGMIIAGAAGSYAIAFQTGDVLTGIVFGMLIGGALSLIHAVLTITFNRNQVVSGIGLTILGTGLSGLLGKSVVGKALTALQPIPIPILNDIPFIGEVFFDQNILVYLSFLLPPILWFILYKTRIGILIRSAGENPSATQNQGANVKLIRYLSVVFGGMMAGLGGAYLSLG
ncbi:MAG: ABC transporter permease, partial [Candidatus Hodarchaeales archaeon]